MFISPMGEPFHGPDPVGIWFGGADADHDGIVTQAEFVADAQRFFTLLDRGRDGEIDPDDIEYYETILAPEIRTGGGGFGGPGGGRGRGGGGRRGGGGGGGGGGSGGRRGGGSDGGSRIGSGEGGEAATPSIGSYDAQVQGAARLSFFGYPEPVTATDANLNRGVDRGEFRDAAIERFGALDKRGDGRLVRDELPRLSLPSDGRGGPRGPYRGGRGGFGGRRPPGTSADDSKPERDRPDE